MSGSPVDAHRAANLGRRAEDAEIPLGYVHQHVHPCDMPMLPAERASVVFIAWASASLGQLKRVEEGLCHCRIRARFPADYHHDEDALARG